MTSIQPLGWFWQELEPSQATGMALARCILGMFLGVVCHCFPLPFDVPLSPPDASTSPTTRALLVAKGGTTSFRDLRHGTDGFTSPPKEGMLRIFSPEKSDCFGRV
jgi:hypothetical protein